MQGKRRPILSSDRRQPVHVGFGDALADRESRSNLARQALFRASTQKRISVPEPSVNVLLLMGLGVTSLVSYGVRRRKRGA